MSFPKRVKDTSLNTAAAGAGHDESSNGVPHFPQDKFSILVNSIPAIITYVDNNHCLQYVNEAFEKAFDKSRNEVVGKPLADFIGKEAYDAIRVYMEAALSGKQVHYEMEVPLKDGQRYIEATYTPDIDENGKVNGYVSMINDITKKKKTEEALYISEGSNKALMESIPVALYSCDAEGYITSYNQASVELWGREPVLGKDKWCGSWKIYQADGITPLEPDSCPTAVTLKEGRPVRGVEIIVERPDGLRHIIQPYPVPVFDKNGKLTGAMNMLVDITESKKTEKEVAKLAAIVHSSVDPIISKTLTGIITSWNEAAERVFGYTAEEMIGQPLTTLIPPDRQEEEPMILERLKKGELVEHFETKRITKDKKLLDISLTISPVKDSKGNIIGASKIVRDITVQKALNIALIESEERLRMAINSTRLGTWEFFPLTGSLTWSAQCRKIYDAPDDIEVSYEFFSDHIHPEDAGFVQHEIEKAMEPGGDGVYDIQYRILRYSDKKPLWIRAQGKVYFTPERQAERFIGTVLDISKEKSEEEELKNSIELFTIMADNVPAMIWMSGDDKFCDFFNKTWLDFTGRTIEQESKEGWLENVHPDDVVRCISEYQRAYKEQKGNYIEYRLKRKDGQYRWIADNAVPRMNADGSFGGFISACMDIDDQKNSREKIKQSELQLKTISNASPVGLWMTDKNARNTFVNETWIEWTGIPFEKQLGTGWLDRVVEEDREAAPARFRECMEKKEKYSAEFRITRPDGELRWCLTEGAPYYDINGKFAGYAGSVTDITELKKMEERKDSFIQMASHELKTPITSIKGYVQLLLAMYDETDKEKFELSQPLIKTSLNTISKQVSKLTRLVSELLDLSKIETGKLELDKTSFPLTDLVEEAVQDVRHTSTRHTIHVHNDFTGNIYADKDRISQVLLNMLTNAIKYSPSGNAIDVYVTSGEGSAIIKVKDHGIGIDKKEQHLIFQRFYRAEGKSEQTYPGFGIGLFIANEILQRHNGTISVESEKGKGSVFTVTLPLSD